MDVSKLIESVKCRVAIWNRQHPRYNDRDLSLALWKEVANENGITVESAKWKWRGLRDSFRIHLRKSISAEKQGALQPVTWIYYEEMSFLKDQIYVDVNRRRYWPEGSVNETAIKRYGKLSSSEEDDGTGVEGFRKKKSKPSTTDSTRSSRLSSSTNKDSDQNSDNFEIIIKEEVGIDFCSPAEVCAIEENTRLEPDSAKDNFEFTLHRSTDEDESFSKSSILYKKFKALQDDNYCFLKSVLPQMKALPAEKKFLVRIKIQKLLLTEVSKLQNDLCLETA
ncbi:BESS motif [Nesidiocoris tenuis]|uniref:BESS motif n=1 Tax=Nesidiocoris tenuis TaxID=355587 RepID=A0ABN7B8S8_9HEMI|nr:BESS motif [Nesidiocoris tenuis]